MGSSLAWRAALAVALMVCFYALALGVTAGLVWIPYAEWRYANRFHPKVAAFCLIGALLILKAIVPRPDRFRPPGPLLEPSDQPRLFAEIRGISEAAGQALPAEVYLVPDVNAWVSQRGGLMGFGSRRLMGLGLPLLQALRVPELRAVIAHEFGHYHGGDVRIGPWVYKTRVALGRTLQQLGEHSGLLTKPFELYAALFVRVTHAVSRHQERQADALAARIAGAPALANGLKTTHGAAVAFQPYWSGQVEPVLSAGFLPPLAGGFARFLEEPNVARAIGEAVREELGSERHDPYDTHPPLRERLAALAEAASSAPPAAGPPALSLLDDVPILEQLLVSHLADDGLSEGGGLPPPRPTPDLKNVSWEEVGPKVHVPNWHGFLRQHGAALAGITPASLPDFDWRERGRKLAAAVGEEANQAVPLAEYAVGCALGLALMRTGFVLQSSPGAPSALVREGERIEPFLVRERLAGGREEAEWWRAFCARSGIAEVDLSAVADPA